MPARRERRPLSFDGLQGESLREALGVGGPSAC